eukprot:m.22682 g.22682  ORF g.22682 m.22682 type:complete len:369 (-) comp11283_c0_seq1:124-1230(-)
MAMYSDTETRRGDDDDSSDSEPTLPASPLQATVLDASQSAHRSSSVTSSPNRNRLLMLKRTASIADPLYDEIQHECNTTSENLLTAKTDSLELGDPRPSSKRAKPSHSVNTTPTSHTPRSAASRRSSRGSPVPRGRSSPLIRPADGPSNPGKGSAKAFRHHPRSPSLLRRSKLTSGNLHLDGDASDSQASDGYTASPPSLAATPDLKLTTSSPLNPSLSDALVAVPDPSTPSALQSPASLSGDPVFLPEERSLARGGQLRSVSTPVGSSACRPTTAVRDSAHPLPSTSAVFGARSTVSMNDYQHGERPWAAPTAMSDQADRGSAPSTADLLEQLNRPGTRLRDGMGNFSLTSSSAGNGVAMDASEDAP